MNEELDIKFKRPDMTTPTDTRCLACGLDRECVDPFHFVAGEDVTDQFAPPPSTTDAVAEARTRLVMRSHSGPLNRDTVTDRLLWQQYEAAIVARERERYGVDELEGLRTQLTEWDSRLVRESNATRARIEVLEALVKAAREAERCGEFDCERGGCSHGSNLAAALAALDKQETN